MGFLDKIKSLFSTPAKEPEKKGGAVNPSAKLPVRIDVYSPCNGNLVAQKDIPDPGFSEGHMGSGFGIEPTSDEFFSFMEGELVVLFRTKHAYIIKDNKTGISVMLHIGINTVEIPEDKGAFSTTRAVNENLKMGDFLCNANLETIKAEGKSIITALLVQTENMEDKKITYHKQPGDSVKSGDLLLSIVSA